MRHPKQPAYPIFVASFLFISLAAQALAGFYTDSRTDICDHAAEQAARTYSVPVNLLKAITRTESGKTHDGTFKGWPWTVNIEGKGSYFQSKQSALAYIQSALHQGYTNVDIGCFQVNFRWHNQHFSSVSQMLDPMQNARYAAQFLSELYREFGEWETAAGAFHSRDSEHSSQYLDRFLPILASLSTSAPFPIAENHRSEKENDFPLLIPGVGGQSRGSLFPSSVSPRRSLISNSDRNE